MPLTPTKFLEDNRLDIARGLVRGAKLEHKFGAVRAMSINTTGTVWDRNDTVYPWSTIDNSGAGRTLTIKVVEPNNEASVSTAENGKQVKVYGLDVNFNEIDETINISGSAGTGTTTFRRIYRAQLLNGSVNTKRILIQANSVNVAQITENLGQTLMSVYTVPANKEAYVTQGIATAQSGADGTGNFFIRQFGDSLFRVGHSFEVSGSHTYFYPFSVPLRLPEKYDLDVRITTRSNNGRFTAAWDMILIDKPVDRNIS